jgi:hypothetical protein
MVQLIDSENFLQQHDGQMFYVGFLKSSRCGFSRIGSVLRKTGTRFAFPFPLVPTKPVWSNCMRTTTKYEQTFGAYSLTAELATSWAIMQHLAVIVALWSQIGCDWLWLRIVRSLMIERNMANHLLPSGQPSTIITFMI